MKTKLLMILTALLMLGGIDAKAQYYWYVGTTEPTAASNPATDPGWTECSSKPISIHAYDEDPDWNDVQWYLAAPAEWHLGMQGGGWIKTQVTINGVLYDVWKCGSLVDSVNKSLFSDAISTDLACYWYVGNTEPTAASNPATDSGWTKLDSKPDNIDIWTEDPDWNDVQWYIAAPAEWHFDTTVNGSYVGGWEKTQVTINGVLYDVWTSLVLKETVSVTLANIGGSTDPTYYWYVGNTEPTSSTDPTQDLAPDDTSLGWTQLDSKPDKINVFAEDPNWNDVQWYLAAPAEWHFDTTFNGIPVGGWIKTQVIINGVLYDVWTAMSLKDSSNLTLANVGGSTDLTYYNLTYKVVDGMSMTFGLSEGAAITPGPKPTKEGYTFSGWSEIPTTMPAEDVTITGSFQLINDVTYTLTYKVDDEVYKTYELSEGDAITPESEPTKEGYTFSGWSEIPEIMPAEDVTITGTFSLPATDDVITLKDTGKGTWCSDYDLDFTDVEGIKAYTATGYDDVDKTIWLTRVFKVPAGTGIMVKGDPGEHKIPHATVKAVYASFFKGVTGSAVTINETDGDNTNYYMAGGQFKKVNGSTTISPNRAYLQLPTLVFAGTRSIDVIYEDEIDDKTGIHSAAITSDQEPGIYYNLQGQRVDNPKKGIYIKNGKKVVIK